ncbi:hypothetical protein EGW08_005691 [Elysia chlorotica]|uniref:Nuclear protein MDM1 n=1 Tax=Elysia chlorotica TaxID=188477 RepID=A0A433TYC1_ELYCH|nr:hypothetical protein EGW08_005691 [Elysia chlorotica]
MEDMAGTAGQSQTDAAPTPRKKRSRPNKLIQAIQESVRRYERERQSIRQLHQVRRAQIYSGPTWDLALFRKIVEQHGSQGQGQATQGDGTPHSATTTSTTHALTWEEYLKEQLKVIQEERKSASSTRKSNPTQARDSPKSASVENKRTPRIVHASGESGSLAERDNHNSTSHKPQKQGSEESNSRPQENHNHNTNSANNSSNNNNLSNNSKTSPNSANKTRPETTTTQPLRRAQTARVVRTAHSGENHQEETTAPLDVRNHHNNPRWFTSREATRIRQELAQQQLIKAYRPSVGMELFRSTNFGYHQSSRGGVRPQSTMSTKTTTSGNSLTNGRQSQSRGMSRESDYSTIMTSSGSRRIRTPGPYGEGNTSQPVHARPRHPLIFKDPEEYDKSKRKLPEVEGET